MREPHDVLVVDDDPDVVWGIGRCLTRAGFSVVTCGDGAEAIPILQARSFDALITDIQMPGLNGLRLIDWVRENRPEIEVVVITAYGCPSLRETSMRKGALLYLEKPVDPELLIEVLRASGEGDRFCGTVNEIELADYLQLLLLNRNRALLEVTSRSGREGLLFIDEGEILHAECGAAVGDEAVFQILAFEAGSFVSLPWRKPPKVTIRGRSGWFFLEAARRKDEAAREGVQPLDAATTGEELAAVGAVRSRGPIRALDREEE